MIESFKITILNKGRVLVCIKNGAILTVSKGNKKEDLTRYPPVWDQYHEQDHNGPDPALLQLMPK